MAKEHLFQGLGVAQGIAIGPAYVRESGAVDVPERRIHKKEVASEQKRLTNAVHLARRQVRALQKRASAKSGMAAEELTILLDAYLHMLEDSRLVRGAQRRIADELVNAEAAVKTEVAAIAQVFQAMDDAYIAARIDDIREVGNRLQRNLAKKPLKPFSAVPKGSIVITEQMTPADTAQLDPAQVAGAAASLGGTEGHAAIMARALGLPTVLGAAGLMGGVRTGDMVIVDSSAGRWPSTTVAAPTLRARRGGSIACRALPPSPATAPRSTFRPTSSCPSRWRWWPRRAPPASAFLGASSCS
jgi:phosphotransferase system enzyme I (PtsI)